VQTGTSKYGQLQFLFESLLCLPKVLNVAMGQNFEVMLG
jgi:hypothetical protein